MRFPNPGNRVRKPGAGRRRKARRSGAAALSTPSRISSSGVPASRGRQAAGVTVGIMHGRGRRAMEQLRALGVGLPAEWRVQQDHQRRGLVVRVTPGAEHAEVLGWACRAGSALCLGVPTGEWRASVHLPASDSPSGTVRE